MYVKLVIHIIYTVLEVGACCGALKLFVMKSYNEQVYRYSQGALCVQPPPAENSERSFPPTKADSSEDTFIALVQLWI